MEDNLKQLAQLHDENIELKKEIERLKGEQLVWIDTKIDPPQKGDVILGWRVEKDLGYIVPMEWNPSCDTPEEYPYYMPYPLPPKQ